MKHQSVISFLLVLLLATPAFCARAKAEDGPADYYNVGGTIITTPVFIHGDHVADDPMTSRLILPTVTLPLTDQSKVAVQFTFFDCDQQKNLEATLDEKASHIHVDCQKHFDEINKDGLNPWPDPWLTRGSDGFDFNTVIAHTAGKTTLYYWVAIPGHYEGWSWSLTPEKNIVVEIPIEFVEEHSIDIE